MVENRNRIEKIMKTTVKVFFILLLVVGLNNSFAQNKIITGTVTSKEGPISKAKVTAVGADVTVKTDKEGNFSIEVPGSVEKLEITKWNHRKKEVSIDGSKELKVKIKEERAVVEPYACNMLIESQTSMVPAKGSKELIIHHRMGKIEKIDDLFGIYAPANVRMSFNYSILDNLMLTLGTEKNKKYQDLMWKWNILQQTRSNSMPITLTYYGNIAMDARDKELFGAEYNFTNRFSYFTQLIVSRKFNDRFTLQLAPSFTHFNSAGKEYDHDKVGLMFGGRAKIHNEMSLLFEYHQPFHIQSLSEQLDLKDPSKPTLGLGLEFATATHAFQIFASSTDKILPQEYYMYNVRDITEGDVIVGFNVTVRF